MKTIKELFESTKRPTVKYDVYFSIYEELFSPYRGKDVVFVEVGVLGGGSLEVWKNYFGLNSRIIGVDLNPSMKKELTDDGYEIYVGDQASQSFWCKFTEEVGMIDILLDDGGHTNKQIITTVRSVISHIRDGGLLVVEDTHTSYLPEFGNPSKNSFMNHSYKLVDLVNSRSGRLDRNQSTDKYEDYIRHSVFSIHYYESIVAMKIDRKHSYQSQKVVYGSVDCIGNKTIPADLRRHKKEFHGMGRLKKVFDWFLNLLKKSR